MTDETIISLKEENHQLILQHQADIKAIKVFREENEQLKKLLHETRDYSWRHIEEIKWLCAKLKQAAENGPIPKDLK